jgi:hypothetical protein
MASPYAFRSGPTFRGAAKSEQFEAAFDQPMSIGATLTDQAAGGVLQSFGLGTVIRDFAIPQGAPTEPGMVERALETAPLIGPIAQGYGALRDLVNPPSTKPPMTAEEWKTSPYFRTNIPYDASMTEDRAAALAIWDDARKVREFYAEKRPITSFIGNLAGQALDPINYIPVAGPAVKGAAALKFGHVLGGVAAGALDAAANTAVAGFATAGERGQYGDDVSWQAQISEIATAALIGGAFGGIGGVFSGRNVSRATAEAMARTATLKTTMEARVAINDAAVSMSLFDDVEISATAKESVQRIADREQAAAVAPTADVPRMVVTPDGRRAEVKSEIVDARDLVAAAGDLQPRDRSRQQSDVQIEDIAINLDPMRLMFAPETDRGAPIVGPDNVVESGNGRRAALIRAAEAYPERFEAYKQALREQGFSVPNEGVPILVSRRTSAMTPDERIAFVTGSNTSAIARMSATEAALTDVRAMTDDVVSAYAGGDVKLAGNREFVRGFLGRLPPNEAAALVDADGALNADGVRRLENGLVAAAYGDPDLVARFAEATDNNAKSITGALSDVAGDWTRMRRAVQAGEISPDLDLTPNVLGALRLISRAREQAALQGRPVSHLVDEAVRQVDMMDGAIDPRTEAIVQLFYGETYARAKSRDDIAIAMRAIVEEVEAAGRPQLFADTAVSGIDIVNAVSGRAPDQRNMFDEPQGNGTNREGPAQGGQAVEKPVVPGAGQPDPGSPQVGNAPRLNLPTAEDGLAGATARAGKSDDFKAMAEQYGVDPKTGDFLEMADIDQLVAQGRASQEDLAALGEATANFDRAKSYGDALITAARCMVA